MTHDTRHKDDGIRERVWELSEAGADYAEIVQILERELDLEFQQDIELREKVWRFIHD